MLVMGFRKKNADRVGLGGCVDGIRYHTDDDPYIMSRLLNLINSSSTMRFIHINEYEYMNNYSQYIILHTRIRIQ